ncbi:MAG: rhodanese-like domain-containing protein [Pseudomonadota bacterium]
MPKTLKDLVDAAYSRIETLTAEEAIAKKDDPSIQLIDIRDIRELWRDGAVPGAYHCPRGMLEFWIAEDSPYTKDVFQAKEKTFVFFCAGGQRSALAADVAQDLGLTVAHVGSGFRGWKEAGGPVEAKEQKAR